MLLEKILVKLIAPDSGSISMSTAQEDEMNGNKPGMSGFFVLFLLAKLVLVNFSDGQSTDIQDSTVWKRGKVKTESKEVGKCFVS